MNIYTYLRIKQAGILDNIKSQAGNLAGKAGDAFNNVVKPTVVNAANQANDFYQENMEPTVSNAINTANDFYQDKVAPTVNSAADAAGNAFANGRKWVVEKTPEYKALQARLDKAKGIIRKGSKRYADRANELEDLKDYKQKAEKALPIGTAVMDHYPRSIKIINKATDELAKAKSQQLSDRVFKNSATGALIGGSAGYLGKLLAEARYGEGYFKNMARDKNNKWYKRMLGNMVDNGAFIGGSLGAGVGLGYGLHNAYKDVSTADKAYKQYSDALSAIPKDDGWADEIEARKRLAASEKARSDYIDALSKI